MSQKMAEAAAKGVQVEILKGDAVKDKDIQYATLEELNSDLEKEPLTVRLYNPKTDTQHFLEFRYPTPSENALMEGSLLSERVIDELREAGENKQQPTGDLMIRALSDMVLTAFEKMVITLAVCSINPPGITPEIVKGWDPLWIDAIYTELEREMRETTTAVDTFHQVGESTGERQADTSGAEDVGEEQGESV